MTANPLSTIPPIGPTTGMSPLPPNGRFKPLDPVRLLRRHMWLLIGTGILGIALGVGIWIGLRQTMPAHTSKAQLEVTSGNSGDVFDANMGSDSNVRSEAIAEFINNQINYIQSDQVLSDALGRIPDDNQWLAGHNGNLRAAREDLQENLLSVSPQRRSTLINLSVSTRDPDDAPVILDAVITTYLNAKKLASDNDGSDLRKVFLAELDRAEDAMRQISQRKTRFIQDNKIEALRGIQGSEQIEYSQLTQERVELNFMLDQAAQQYETLSQSSGSREMTDNEYNQLKFMPEIALRYEQLANLREQRHAYIAAGKKENHPFVTEMDSRLEATQAELNNLHSTELGKLRSFQLQQAAQAKDALSAQIAALEPRLAASSTKLQDLNAKLTEFEFLEDSLEQAKLQQADAKAALDRNRIRSARPDAARVRRQVGPTEAKLTFPDPKLTIGGVTFFLLALVGGIVTLREMLDETVRSPQDVKLLPDAAMLGLIPHCDEDPSGGGSAERTVERSPTGLLAESYRQVRTSLLSKMDRRGYKTVMCVSAQPGSGTSTVVNNLATSLAYNGRKVLILDVNFRRPAQHKFFERSNRRGLIDLLRKTATPEQAIKRKEGLTLYLLPTGDAGDSPPEMLESKGFRTLLGQLESKFDMVVIDAPPALLTSDSQLLSKHVDAIAIIAKAGADKRGMLSRMLGQLDGQRADILGIVLNGVRSSVGGYFRKSYEDFYNYRDTKSTNGHEPASNGKPRTSRGKATNGKRAKRSKKADVAEPIDAGATQIISDPPDESYSAFKSEN